MTAFWGAAAGKLAERLLATGLSASVYWLAMLMAWALGHAHPRTALAEMLRSVGAMRTGEQFALLLLVLVGLGGSALLVRQLTLPALRFLEGYWPAVLAPLGEWLRERHQRHREAGSAAWRTLHDRLVADPSAPTQPPLNATERLRYAQLDMELRWSPRQPALMMPTPVGNILRAAEAEPWHKYGLDAVLLWPHLWTVLPDTLRQDLSAARQRLNQAVAAGMWCLLVLPAMYWTLWALLALPAAGYAWGRLLPRTCFDYGILLQASFDLHRHELYRALRHPLPADAAAEQAAGRRLTAYVHRGSDDPAMVFDDGY